MRVLAIILTMLLPFGGAWALEPGDRTAIRGVIQAQIEAFRRDDARGAYARAAPGVQRAFPSEEGFLGMVRESYRPVYRPRSYAFGALEDTPAGPSQRVRIKDAEGVDWEAEYILERQPDGSWRIAGCRLTKEPGEAA